MSDVLDRLDRFDPVPDIDVDAGWSRVQRRVRRRNAAQRGLAGVGLVALLAGGLVLVRGGDDDRTTRVTTASTTTPPSPEAGWSQLPEMPIEPRINPAMTEMDDGDLFVWGGYTPGSSGLQLSDGAVFDAASQTWEVLPPAPDVTVNEARAIFTRDLVVVMPSSGTTPFRPTRWYPATNTWAVGATGRSVCGENRDPVWTGTEIMVTCEDTSIDAYDPGADRWRTLPPTPGPLDDPRLTWTGEALLVFGRGLNNTTVEGQGYGYTPEENGWFVLALTDPSPVDISPTASDVTWTGSEMVAVNGEGDAAAYNPDDDMWRDLPRVPLPTEECGAEAVAAGAVAFVDLCSGAAILAPDDSWTVVPAGGGDATGVGYGAIGGSASITSADGDGRLWIYTPPEADGAGRIPFEAPIPLGISTFSPPPGGEILSMGREEIDGSESIRAAVALADGTRCEVASGPAPGSWSGDLVSITTADGWQGDAVADLSQAGQVSLRWAWNDDLRDDLQEATCPTLEQAVQVAEGFNSPA